MRLLSASHLLLLLTPALPFVSAETTTTSEAPPACTASGGSTAIGGFFDLRPDIAVAPEEEGKLKKRAVTTDYHANGFDYKSNFTLNICAPVVKPVSDVVGLSKTQWQNVSAYYTSVDGDIYSIGQESMRLQTRGRKLVLQYTGGSPCGKSAKSKRDSRAVHDGATYKYEDYVDDEDASTEDKTQATRTKSHDDEDDEDEDDKHKESDRRKSTIISFLCDRDPLATHAAVHFVGTDPDECAYFFEVRSQHACIAAEPHQPGTIGPGGVFGLIVGIALVVYFAGGIFYQRTVAHARGWRQLPNHNIWQGIWTFISDFVIIGAASCARLLPGQGGYRPLSRSPTNWRNRDDENRLIDQLDEEWDD